MNKLPLIILVMILTVAFAPGQNQNANSSANKNAATRSSNKTRGAVFKATADQIKQAQAILKQRNVYVGEQTGKLDADTRAGLKKYQQAEGLKVTGTLNKVTLQKMSIDLTDKQKSM